MRYLPRYATARRSHATARLCALRARCGFGQCSLEIARETIRTTRDHARHRWRQSFASTTRSAPSWSYADLYVASPASPASPASLTNRAKSVLRPRSDGTNPGRRAFGSRTQVPSPFRRDTLPHDTLLHDSLPQTVLARRAWRRSVGVRRYREGSVSRSRERRLRRQRWQVCKSGSRHEKSTATPHGPGRELEHRLRYGAWALAQCMGRLQERDLRGGPTCTVNT